MLELFIQLKKHSVNKTFLTLQFSWHIKTEVETLTVYLEDRVEGLFGGCAAVL